MSRAHLHQGAIYLQTAGALRDAGYSFREVVGRKHGKFVVPVNGREETIVISGSPSDWRAERNALGFIRRRIREWKAEAATLAKDSAAPAQASVPSENETMNDSSASISRPSNDALVTMSSREIAGLVGSRHDKVKQSIDRLVERGVIVRPPLGDEQFADAMGRPRSERVYRIGKRDSYVIVAQLSPEFTARLVDRWQELEDANAAHLAVLPADWDRALGMLKMLARKSAETDKALTEIQAYLTDPHSELTPAFNLSGSVTALQVIGMAHVASDQRVRGTSGIVTRHMKDYCLKRGLRAFQTPEAFDPNMRWRFPVEAAQAWLTGPDRGSEIIQSHVARARAKANRKGQMSLQLVGEPRR